MDIKERVDSYNDSFQYFSTQAPLMVTKRWIYGVWMIGNLYKNRSNYYGEYPHTYLKRIYSLFPDVFSNEILHLFSGSLNERERGDKFDINSLFNPTYVGDVNDLSKIVPKNKYRLIIADPPYSDEDAIHYGTCMINRNKVIKECVKILCGNGFIVWLDQVLPMYNKKDVKLIGTIGLIRSTNHRVRCIFIWQKVSKINLLNRSIKKEKQMF